MKTDKIWQQKAGNILKTGYHTHNCWCIQTIGLYAAIKTYMWWWKLPRIWVYQM